MTPAEERQIIQQAAELARNGKADEAEQVLARAARNHPASEQLVRTLVDLRLQMGRGREAVEVLRKAIDAQPQNLTFLTMMAQLLMNADPAGAEQAVRAALGYRPNSPELICMLGDALLRQRRAEDALTAYRHAVTGSPRLVFPYIRLGEALRMLRRFDESISVLRTAAGVDANSPEVQHALGVSLAESGKADEAETAFRQAIRVQPKYISGYGSLGRLLHFQRRFAEAEQVYRDALKEQANHPLVHLSLGHLMLDQNRRADAEAEYRAAIAADPRFVPAVVSLSSLLVVGNRFMEAIGAANHAVQVAPNSADALQALGTGLHAIGQAREAVKRLSRAWQLGGNPATGSNLLQALNYVEDAAPREVLEAHEGWARRHADPVSPQFEHNNSRETGRKLKIGYVSPDFRAHAVSYFIESILASHDREQFDVYCYASVSAPDEVTERLKSRVGHWVDISRMNDVQAARQIHADGIDILVDLAGHTNGNRLGIFTARPAPVQVTYLGYPNTTGMAAMGYRITDAHADPVGTAEQFSSEKLVRLPRTAWCYRPPEDAPDVGELPAAKNGFVTFGSFNRLAKLSAKTLECWCKTLAAVPGSKLLFKSGGLNEPATENAVRDAFKRQGIDGDRLVLVGFDATPREHLERYNQIDIALDCFPYHGTTTTCEAMWMGVPSVVLVGQTHVSRVGLSLLANVGLPEFATDSVEKYVGAAAAAAGDVAKLAELRRGMRDRLRGSPIMDAAGFTRELESVYREMWSSWCGAQQQ